ncbi:MAG: lytic transglycosylase domain-containing protein [Paludibacteraceae bacterium]|nr:lytic transglycosylase domain-containing protein [Paludibacteraceae bacterium]
MENKILELKNRLLLIVSVTVTLFALYSFTPAEKNNGEDQSIEQKIKSFAIPDSIKFADENVPLTRFDLRERFDREISVIAYQHSFTLLSLKRANRYFPIIEPILKKNGVPTDFKYLALIESNFSNRVVSPAKAAGFWQLMPATAQELGLEVTDEVDERYNIEKSTEAACRYFKRAYAKFGDWVVVAASYNAGMGRLSEELQKQQQAKFYDLWMNDETSRYVFRLLAMKAFLAEPQKYGYCLKKEEFYPTVRCAELQVDSAVEDWASFAKAQGVPYGIFKDFNTWLRDRRLQNKAKKTYKILIPNKEDLDFNVNKIQLYQKNWSVQ